MSIQLTGEASLKVRIHTDERWSEREILKQNPPYSHSCTHAHARYPNNTRAHAHAYTRTRTHNKQVTWLLASEPLEVIIREFYRKATTQSFGIMLWLDSIAKVDSWCFQDRWCFTLKTYILKQKPAQHENTFSLIHLLTHRTHNAHTYTHTIHTAGIQVDTSVPMNNYTVPNIFVYHNTVVDNGVGVQVTNLVCERACARVLRECACVFEVRDRERETSLSCTTTQLWIATLACESQIWYVSVWVCFVSVRMCYISVRVYYVSTFSPHIHPHPHLHAYTHPHPHHTHTNVHTYINTPIHAHTVRCATAEQRADHQQYPDQ